MTQNADSVGRYSDLSPPYATIVADPPWPYPTAFGQGDGPPRTVKRDGTLARGTAQMGYGVMTMADLILMPVEYLADRNAHLYLWTTNAFVHEAYCLAGTWGFRAKSLLTWTKTHQDDPGRVSMKTGAHFRGATEHVVFGVRGSLPLQAPGGFPTGYLWPRIGSHSVKPQAFYDLVERVSPGPYLELFARAPRLGWDHWGRGFEVSPNGSSGTAR